MIDFSPERWKEWVSLQRKKAIRKAWWNATHRGEFERILTDRDSLLMFQEIMSREYRSCKSCGAFDKGEMCDLQKKSNYADLYWPQ